MNVLTTNPRVVDSGLACWLCWARRPEWHMSIDDGDGLVHYRYFCSTCHSLLFPVLPPEVEKLPGFKGKLPNVVRLDAAALIAEAESRLRERT